MQTKSPTSLFILFFRGKYFENHLIIPVFACLNTYIIIFDFMSLFPGMVTHACNTNYLGGVDQEDGCLRLARGEKTNKLGVVDPTYDLNYARGINRRAKPNK
jgi:hypothetical protein